MTNIDFDRERIRRIRMMLAMTQEQFAKKLGVNVNIVRRWEQGTSIPTRGPNVGKLLAAEREAQKLD